MLRSALSALRGPKTGLQRLGPADKVHVAMSSGVDSATVAALLARELGPKRVEGVFMNNWQATARCAEADWSSVQDICGHIGITSHRIDLEQDYWIDVFEPMVAAYRSGTTPNPDVSCNRHIKFGSLIRELRKRYPQHFRWLATGHYAGLINGKSVGRPDYLRKDQSYYLATVDPKAWDHVLFPLAHLTKPQVRELAADLLPAKTAEKPDSQGLCFVEQSPKKFSVFLEDYLEPFPGPVRTADGREVGTHQGLWTATIGQRTSISMPQSDPASRGPWYVIDKDIPGNALIIGPGLNHANLWTDVVWCDQFEWHTSGPRPEQQFQVQYRSLQEPTTVATWRSIGGSGVEMILEQPRRAIAAGQYLVAYNGDAVIGAGIISGSCRNSNPTVQPDQARARRTVQSTQSAQSTQST